MALFRFVYSSMMDLSNDCIMNLFYPTGSTSEGMEGNPHPVFYLHPVFHLWVYPYYAVNCKICLKVCLPYTLLLLLIKLYPTALLIKYNLYRF